MNSRSYAKLLHRYHALVEQKHLRGLTAAEARRMEELRQMVDDYNARFYARIEREEARRG